MTLERDVASSPSPYPSDESVPRIGDELAAARALSDLAHQLLAAAATDIESKTHQPVRSLEL